MFLWWSYACWIFAFFYPPMQHEMRHIDLTMYGEPRGFTAMARTVGWPTAIASKMILSGESDQTTNYWVGSLIILLGEWSLDLVDCAIQCNWKIMGGYKMLSLGQCALPTWAILLESTVPIWIETASQTVHNCLQVNSNGYYYYKY